MKCTLIVAYLMGSLCYVFYVYVLNPDELLDLFAFYLECQETLTPVKL